MIGYYAHSHGHGHSNYAQLLAEELRDELLIFTSSNYLFNQVSRVIELPDEDKDGTELNVHNCSKPRFLHYNPLGIKKIRERSHTLLDQIIYKSIKIMLIDVSVEVATLCRVSSVPYAYRRMPGNRNDLAHVEAYRGAVFLFAYYPREFENTQTPQWIIDKTCYLGFIAPENNVQVNYTQKQLSHESITEILFLMGLGGNNISFKQIEQLAIQFPNATIHTVGKFNEVPRLNNLQHHGVVDSIEEFVETADVIFTACGSGTVARLLAMNRKFICVPQIRPFQEQNCIAEQIVRNDLGTSLENYDFKKAVEELLLLDTEIPPKFKPQNMTHFAQACREYESKLIEHEELTKFI